MPQILLPPSSPLLMLSIGQTNWRVTAVGAQVTQSILASFPG